MYTDVLDADNEASLLNNNHNDFRISWQGDKNNATDESIWIEKRRNHNDVNDVQRAGVLLTNWTKMSDWWCCSIRIGARRCVDQAEGNRIDRPNENECDRSIRPIDWPLSSSICIRSVNSSRIESGVESDRWWRRRASADLSTLRLWTIWRRATTDWRSTPYRWNIPRLFSERNVSIPNRIGWTLYKLREWFRWSDTRAERPPIEDNEWNNWESSMFDWHGPPIGRSTTRSRHWSHR